MSASPLSEQVALRIGLAAREMGDVCPRQMVDILFAAIGKPISVRKLSRLRFNRFRQIAAGMLDHPEEPPLRRAFAFLKGDGIQCEPDPLPEVSSYGDGDMPGSIRVACSSDSGHMVNGGFGTCPRFLIYQVSAGEIRLIEIRAVRNAREDTGSKGEGKPGEDKHELRARLIADCHVLVTTSIGGPATSKVVNAGLHPIKLDRELPAPVFLRQLQQVLLESPPPWLAKLAGQEPETRARYSRTHAHDQYATDSGDSGLC